MWWHDFFDDDALWLFGPTLDAERTEREVAGAVRLLRLREGMRLADLGCGSGRHTAALTRRGVVTVGMEWSPASLAAALRRTEALEIPARYARADLRRLPLKTASCDAAMSLFSTLGYESDLETETFLREAKRVLKPGGRLLVEVMGRDLAVRSFHTRREWYEIDGRPVRIERSIDLVAGEERAVFHYDRGQGPREKPFTRRLYTPTELAAMLTRAGFSQLSFSGDYDGAPLSLDAPHLLVVARA